MEELRKIVPHVSQVLSENHWREGARLHKVAQGERLKAFLRKRDSHDLVWYRDAWTCCKCLTKIRPSSSLKQFNSTCSGSSLLDEVLSNQSGHDLQFALVEGGGVVYFCSTCFAIAETVPRKLSKPCSRVLGPFGPTAKSRIRRGLHPGDVHRRIFRSYAVSCMHI